MSSQDQSNGRPKIIHFPQVGDQTLLNELAVQRDEAGQVMRYYTEFFGFLPENLLSVPAFTRLAIYNLGDPYFHERNCLFDLTTRDSRRYSRGQIITNAEEDIAVGVHVLESVIPLPQNVSTDAEEIVTVEYSTPRKVKSGEFMIDDGVDRYVDMFVFTEGQWHKRTLIFTNVVPPEEVPVGQESIVDLSNELTATLFRVAEIVPTKVDVGNKAVMLGDERLLRTARREDQKYLSPEWVDAIDVSRRKGMEYKRGLATRKIRPSVQLSWYHLARENRPNTVNMQDVIQVPLELTYIPSEDEK